MRSGCQRAKFALSEWRSGAMTRSAPRNWSSGSDVGAATWTSICKEAWSPIAMRRETQSRVGFLGSRTCGAEEAANVGEGVGDGGGEGGNEPRERLWVRAGGVHKAGGSGSAAARVWQVEGGLRCFAIGIAHGIVERPERCSGGSSKTAKASSLTETARACVCKGCAGATRGQRS